MAVDRAIHISLPWAMLSSVIFFFPLYELPTVGR